MPGLVLAIDGATVDRIIDTTPNDARYFLGLMISGAGQSSMTRLAAGAWDGAARRTQEMPCSDANSPAGFGSRPVEP